MAHVLASPGAGHRALIVLEIFGGIIGLALVALVVSALGTANRDDWTRLLFSFAIMGFAGTIVGYIIGESLLLLLGVVAMVVFGTIGGLIEYNGHRKKRKPGT